MTAQLRNAALQRSNLGVVNLQLDSRRQVVGLQDVWVQRELRSRCIAQGVPLHREDGLMPHIDERWSPSGIDSDDCDDDSDDTYEDQ